MNSGHAGHGTSQMPLAGAILCCTSISPEQRTELGVIGAQMGAVIKLDLTSDVTHLVVGNTNSAKYRYVAKSRDDVKVLDPSWLEALRNVWMEGDDVDVAWLEEQYRLPTFYDLKICLTGFDDPDQRKFIQETVSKNGGEYHGDLTKNVTHLIAASPSGKKYEHAVNWGLKIVTWEWFEQSVERGMVLGEEYYNPTMPPEERGKGALERRQDASPVLGKRTRETIQSNSTNPSRRKLRRSASTRMGSQSVALWAGITAGGLEHTKSKADDWTDTSNLNPESLPAGAGRKIPQAPEVTHIDADRAEDPASNTRGPFLDDKDGIFASRLVFPHGFDRKKTGILYDHLEGNGATVVRESSDLGDFSSDDITRGFLVVPHDISVDLMALPEGSENLSLVTNWWVERCLHGKHLVDPADSLLCRPFKHFPISGFRDLTINLTGFSGIELLQVTKAVTLFGATYDDYLTPKVSVMVCNTRKPNPEKLGFAIEKGIPAVHASWLWECIRKGHQQPYDTYSLTAVAPPQKPKPRSRASLPGAPTAPLSDDFLKNRPNNRNAKTATKPQSGPRRPGALELSLSGPPTPTSETKSSNNTEASTDRAAENELHITFDGANSLPLKDIHPSVNSPHRRPSASTTHSVSDADAPTTKPAPAPRHARRPTPDSSAPAPQPNKDTPPAASDDPKPQQQTDYSDMMSRLLANRKTSNLGSSAEDKARSKKRRPLGRAQSTRSNASTASDAARQNSAQDPDPADQEAKDDDEEAVLQNEDPSHVEAEPPSFAITQASQELGWDSPGAQRARENMIRAMGGKVKGAKSLDDAAAVVTDQTEAVGVMGGRASRRRRG